MTTTISFTSRDCIAIGCDSLGTSMRPMVDPVHILSDFFDPTGKLRLGKDNQPLLKEVAQLSAFVRQVPQDQLPSVTKLFHLKPLKAALTFAGASIVGEHSVKNLVDSFRTSQQFEVLRSDPEITVEKIAFSFFEYVRSFYEKAYATLPDNFKPSMDVVLSGYGKSDFPEVFRLTFSAKPTCEVAVPPGHFTIVFGGQYDVIQRVVFGLDFASWSNLVDRSEQVLRNYQQQLQTFLATQEITVPLPPADTSSDLHLFHSSFKGVQGLTPNLASLSEQAAINLVEFLVDTMIKAQQFSGSIPTVGGDVHVAIITKANGFRWVSKEEYLFRGHAVPKDGN